MIGKKSGKLGIYEGSSPPVRAPQTVPQSQPVARMVDHEWDSRCP